MRRLATWSVTVTVLAVVGCHGDEEAAKEPQRIAKAEARRVPQVLFQLGLHGPS